MTRKFFNLKLIQKVSLIILLLLFIIIKWDFLYILPFHDEFSYIGNIFNKNWSFFLPWNYKPEIFMGHPPLHSFILWSAFSLFNNSPFITKLTALSFSVLCLFSLYKMTESLFQNRWTTFLSLLFTIFLPLFWFHSTLVLAHIPLMAFGFGTIYTFKDSQYKSLLFFSIGLATIRESALAFFLPILLQCLFLPSQRKKIFYILPSLLIFTSHFLIFFIRTGSFFAHPYIYGGLPHGPQPNFFNFSIFFERFVHFLTNFFYQFPYLFWGMFLSSLMVALFHKYNQIFSKKKYINFLKQNQKNNVLKYLLQSKYFIPITISLLFFCFYISYPNYEFRNFFPILIIFIPLSIQFMLKTIPFFHIVFIFIILLTSVQNIFPKSSFRLPFFKFYTAKSTLTEEYKQQILEAKKLVAFLESNYGNKVLNLNKRIYMPFPYDLTMISPFYGYVKNSYQANHWKFFEEPNSYGIVVLIKNDITNTEIPYNNHVYKYLKKSNSFIEQKLPFYLKNFILFINKDVLF